MNFFDHWSEQPLEEFQSAWNRVPHREFAQIGSLKGRAVCVLKIFCHTASLVIKPVVYLVSGVALVTLQSLVFSVYLQKQEDYDLRSNFFLLGANLILTAIVAPIGQIVQIFKAKLGVLHPPCYFKEDELHIHFMTLANIAEDLDCDSEFVEMLKNPIVKYSR